MKKKFLLSTLMLLILQQFSLNSEHYSIQAFDQHSKIAKMNNIGDVLIANDQDFILVKRGGGVSKIRFPEEFQLEDLIDFNDNCSFTVAAQNEGICLGDGRTLFCPDVYFYSSGSGFINIKKALLKSEKFQKILQEYGFWRNEQIQLSVYLGETSNNSIHLDFLRWGEKWSSLSQLEQLKFKQKYLNNSDQLIGVVSVSDTSSIFLDTQIYFVYEPSTGFDFFKVESRIDDVIEELNGIDDYPYCRYNKANRCCLVGINDLGLVVTHKSFSDHSVLFEKYEISSGLSYSFTSSIDDCHLIGLNNLNELFGSVTNLSLEEDEEIKIPFKVYSNNEVMKIEKFSNSLEMNTTVFNDSGAFAGETVCLWNGHKGDPYFFDEENGLRLLNGLKGYVPVFMNNKNTVLLKKISSYTNNYGFDDFSFSCHYVLWSPEKGITNLDDLINSDDWDIEYVLGLNDRGDILAVASRKDLRFHFEIVLIKFEVGI